MNHIKSIIFVLTVLVFSNGFSQEKPKPSPEKIFKKLDIDANGFLTEKEVKEEKFADNFEEIDLDEDGLISLKEFTSFLDAMAKKKKLPKQEEPEEDEEDYDEPEEEVEELNVA